MDDDAHLEAALDALASSRPLAEILTTVLRTAAAALGADDAVVVVEDPSGGPDPIVIRVGTVPGAGDTVADHDLVVGDRRVGSLALAFGGASSGASGDLDGAVGRYARMAAVAWAHARDLAAERAAHRQEQAAIRAGQMLTSTLRLDEVLPAILDELRHVVPYDTASVQELRGDQVVIVAGAGIDEALTGVGFDVDRPGTPNADVVTRRAPVIVPDIVGEHPYWDFPSGEHLSSGVRSWMGVPLVLGNECLGMFTLDSFQADFYTDDHARLAGSFAVHAAIALENARAFERTRHEVEVRRRTEERLREVNDSLRERMSEIERLQADLRDQAVRDPLTGVFNRRYLLEVLHQELFRARRGGWQVSLALLDIDHFKQINDQVGHEGGDRVLVEVATLLAENVREEDVVCRYGGEEFVVVLPATATDVARERAEGWREELGKRPNLVGTGERSLTISVGIATAPDHADEEDALLRAADTAMYLAKGAGRDRVEVAERSSSTDHR